ncbi:SGS-domain-containing protein [Heliocybe sulcata]|uniref:SGS-domain-containing protein n=1 Tax=Heliocybe sulcata TaxID=5364 RepID=A0A5C3NTN0_9AGAM|nr:SGS-domain-containing protein [Heliocybe sulcata]
MTNIRHEFYETEDKVIISVFDKGADPEQVSVKFEPRKLSYKNGEKELVLEPLRSQIDPEASSYTVGKVKVEIRVAKIAQGRWGQLTGDTPDPLASYATPASAPAAARKPQKNWEGITTAILGSEPETSLDQDPNAGGDTAVNSFFQKLYGDADEDTKRAMMKSYVESGGTTLSTNWDEVGKGKVDGKPPQGSEWKKWGA